MTHTNNSDYFAECFILNKYSRYYATHLPKNRLLLYHRYILSKISWYLTFADLSWTWVIENLDNVVVRFVRQWLDLPISANLSWISLPRNKFGVNLLLPSVKSQQHQTSYVMSWNLHLMMQLNLCGELQVSKHTEIPSKY